LSLSVNGERRQRSTTRENDLTVAEAMRSPRLQTHSGGRHHRNPARPRSRRNDGTYLKSGDVMEAVSKNWQPAHARAVTRPRFDLVIGNGTLIDGTGAPPAPLTSESRMVASPPSAISPGGCRSTDRRARKRGVLVSSMPLVLRPDA
jgi:hypothetical protein